jgi:hypothetical protein
MEPSVGIREFRKRWSVPILLEVVWDETCTDWLSSDLSIMRIARDHLASERTWLAYIRTSLAISSSGVALVQLFTIAANRSASDPNSGSGFGGTIQQYARPLGAATVFIGLGVCLLGMALYRVLFHGYHYYPCQGLTENPCGRGRF